ncbi:FAD-dependent oxidoreductase, partial [Aegicerativicinus sediminis]
MKFNHLNLLVIICLPILVFSQPFNGNKTAYEADVVIYGGTSSGVIAAVKAAALNRKVILVSPDEHLGGMSSHGLGF